MMLTADSLCLPSKYWPPCNAYIRGLRGPGIRLKGTILLDLTVVLCNVHVRSVEFSILCAELSHHIRVCWWRF